ncbi:MAG: MFS transporter [Pseudomonadota bacterium]
MSPFAKIAMLVVVFVDLIGQGLVFPILNSMIMEPSSIFLPHDSSTATRHLTYGLVIGIFFLSWFLGAPYIAQLSDVIGRKNAVLICLFGALVGYGVTIISLYTGSLILLILGRAVTGLTAGNQPIAQAALVDGSRDEEDKNRNMGYIMVGISAGLVGGPLIGGLLSDPVIIGSEANLKLPFYASFVIVLAAIALVVFFFHDIRTERRPFTFRPTEVFELLWRVRKYPLVMRISGVLVFFHIANLMFYIFVTNFSVSRFGFDTLATSLIMVSIGTAIAVAGSFLVVPMQARFSKFTIITVNLLVWLVNSILITMVTDGVWVYALAFINYLIFGITYPTFLGLYSASAGEEEQGWVMGITVAIFTLIAGITALLGGELIGIDLYLPFNIVTGAALLALIMQFLTWRGPEMDKLTGR